MSYAIPLRREQSRRLLDLLARGECCALYGLSNTGKSRLLRALPHSEGQDAPPGVLVYVDCNRAVEQTAPGLYEVIVRSLLEALATAAAPPALLDALREHHTAIPSGTAFRASLAFNLALTETCANLGRPVVLLLDEFDEVYAGLEERALLNLRALRDKFGPRLTYLTATNRPLFEIRNPGEDEFAELFTSHVAPLARLSPEEARRLAQTEAGDRLAPADLAAVVSAAGGHLGLLLALIQAALRGGADSLRTDANMRVECLKLWNQLWPEEQVALQTLAADPEAGLPPPARQRLEEFGLLTETGRLFSNLFAAFVTRQSGAPGQPEAGLRVDEDAGEVWVDGVRVTVLTDLEYRLMRLLYERRGRLTTKEMIVSAVWGGQYVDKLDDARIEKLVSRLRAKIEPDPAHPRHLLTQRGRGYKLSSQPADDKPDNGEA